MRLNNDSPGLPAAGTLSLAVLQLSVLLSGPVVLSHPQLLAGCSAPADGWVDKTRADNISAVPEHYDVSLLSVPQRPFVWKSTRIQTADRKSVV